VKEKRQTGTALEAHTRALYDKLVELGKPDPDLDGALVIVARLTDLHGELGIPSNYYAKIRALLFAGTDPCVIMLQRGGAGKPSVLALRHPPEAETFVQVGLTWRGVHGRVSLDAAERIQKLEAWRESLSPADENRLNIVEALRNHETRLAALEASHKGETNGKTAQDRSSH
jgi:hypothetical protein